MCLPRPKHRRPNMKHRSRLTRACRFYWTNRHSRSRSAALLRSAVSLIPVPIPNDLSTAPLVSAGMRRRVEGASACRVLTSRGRAKRLPYLWGRPSRIRAGISYHPQRSAGETATSLQAEALTSVADGRGQLQRNTSGTKAISRSVGLASDRWFGQEVRTFWEWACLRLSNFPPLSGTCLLAGGSWQRGKLAKSPRKNNVID